MAGPPRPGRRHHPRAQEHGAYPGRLLAQRRVITFEFELIPENPADDVLWPQYLTALRTATAVRQDEQPLVVQLAGQRLLAFARITRRAIPADQAFTRGYPAGALQWEASDPRLYDVLLQSAGTGLPAPESGLPWGSPTETGLAWGSPAETGLAWGTSGSSGDITCTNSGTADTNPVIEITGPATRPSLTRLADNTVLEYDLVLTAADTLVIDTGAGTVTLGGQSRIGTATNRSVPEGLFTLPAGSTSTISFRSGDAVPSPSAGAVLRWRSAHW
ncbi:phage tail protein [Kitasatospora gansuensis]